MILLKNTQRSKINKPHIKNGIKKILKNLGYQNFDLGIWFTTNKTIQKYNKTFRQKDKPTDVLSFPFHTTLKANKQILPKNSDDYNLGDIIISVEFCKKNAKSFNTSLNQYLMKIIIHGIAHLLGYDHQTDSEFKTMQKFETKLSSYLLS